MASDYLKLYEDYLREEKHASENTLKDDGEPVLDIVYSGATGADSTGYQWPRELRVTGSAITGTLSVHIDTVFSDQPLPAATFRLTLPPHFTVERVE